MKPQDDAGERENGAFWFKVGEVLKFKEQGDVFDYCVEMGLVENQRKYAHRTLMKLWKIIKEDPLINYFAEEEQNLDKVLNIFIRVNSGGTVLDYADMLLSIATAQWKDRDAREEIHGLVDELNGMGEGFSFDKDFVLKASLVLSDIQAIEFRTTSFKKENMLRIEKAWDNIRAALGTTVSLLSDWGYSNQTLASANATIPLAYWIHRLGCPKNFTTNRSFNADRQSMQNWFRVALMKRTFSGQSDTVLRQVRAVLKIDHPHFPDEAVKEKLRPTNKSMDFGPEEMAAMLDYKYGQSYTFTVLAMLYPWLKFDQVFHVDHIFPKSMFTKKRLRLIGIPEERWVEWLNHTNDIANLQLLQGHKNMSKQDEEFENWLKGECRKPKELDHYRESHMIPEVDLRFEAFPEFVKAREAIMIEKLSELVGTRIP
jgi:hypothetical protein